MKKIGLISGEGRLPLLLYEKLLEEGERVVVVGLREFPPQDLHPHHWVKLGEMGKLLSILEKENIQDIILAGKVEKIEILRYHEWDEIAREILEKAEDRRDSSLLEALRNYFETRGFSFPPLEKYLSSWLAGSGKLTQREPRGDEKRDLALAWKVGRRLAEMDVGHTVVVRGGVVTAVETLEGTDETIKRGGRWGENGGVAKVPRPHQDLRWDPPVVGINTLRVMSRVQIKALVVGSGKTLLLDKENFLKEADRLNIAILGWECE